MLCGAGGPLPDPVRSGPCVAVVAGDNLVVVDAGTGGATQPQSLGLPVGAVDAIFITHFPPTTSTGWELATPRWTAAHRAAASARARGYRRRWWPASTGPTPDAVYRPPTTAIPWHSVRPRPAGGDHPSRRTAWRSPYDNDGLTVQMIRVQFTARWTQRWPTCSTTRAAAPDQRRRRQIRQPPALCTGRDLLVTRVSPAVQQMNRAAQRAGNGSSPKSPPTYPTTTPPRWRPPRSPGRQCRPPAVLSRGAPPRCPASRPPG